MALHDFIASLMQELPPPPTEDLKRAAMATPEAPMCRRCGRPPHEIGEYRELAVDDEGEPVDEPTAEQCREAMREEEGTYNPETGGFYCTDCYIAAGQPLGKAP